MIIPNNVENTKKTGTLILFWEKYKELKPFWGKFCLLDIVMMFPKVTFHILWFYDFYL